MDLSDEDIRTIFQDASDFESRIFRHGCQKVYAYFIDGLVSSGFVSDYIFKPILHLPDAMADAYEAALSGGIYNAVSKPCKDAADVA